MTLYLISKRHFAHKSDQHKPVHSVSSSLMLATSIATEALNFCKPNIGVLSFPLPNCFNARYNWSEEVQRLIEWAWTPEVCPHCWSLFQQKSLAHLIIFNKRKYNNESMNQSLAGRLRSVKIGGRNFWTLVCILHQEGPYNGLHNEAYCVSCSFNLSQRFESWLGLQSSYWKEEQ